MSVFNCDKACGYKYAHHFNMIAVVKHVNVELRALIFTFSAKFG